MPMGNCTKNCWIAGGVLGLLVWIFTAGPGPLRWFEGLFLGIIAAVLMGRFLIWLLCDGAQAEGGESPEPIIPAELMEKVTSAASTLGQKANDLVSGDRAGARETTESSSESLARSDSANAGATEAGSPADEKAAEPAAEPKTVRKANIAAAEASAPSGTSVKTEGQPDDLKQIKGVGPKLEELLHENGVTRFAQIAEWNDAEMERFADLIGRMGSRIRSDDWVGQARLLAAGGETEFSKRVDKGDVY